MSINQVHCKYHPTATLIEDHKAGDLICPKCGLVVAERVIDFESEWRSFANDTDSKDMSRVGEVKNGLKSEAETSITIQQSTNIRHLDEHGNQIYKGRQHLCNWSIYSSYFQRRYTRDLFDDIVECVQSNSKNIVSDEEKLLTLFRCFKNFFNKRFDSERLFKAISYAMSKERSKIIVNWLHLKKAAPTIFNVSPTCSWAPDWGRGPDPVPQPLDLE